MQPAPAFANLDMQGYVDLLDLRLREFNHPQESRRLAAMDLFDRTLMQWTPANEWLRQFFDGLAPGPQTRFRQAIAELLSRVHPGSFPLQALIELIGLAADVSAHEAVRPMLRLVADGGEWTALRPGPLPSVLAALKQLRPGGQAYGAVCRLLASPAFADRLVFDAFEILLRARPEDWGASWVLLRGRFDRAQQGADAAATEAWFARRMRDLAQRCMAALSPWAICQGVDHLNAVLGPRLAAALDPQRPLGMLWLELVGQADSPFQQQPVDDQARDRVWSDADEDADSQAGTRSWFLLCSRRRPDDGVPWPLDWPDWDLQRELSVRSWQQQRRQAQMRDLQAQAPPELAVLFAQWSLSAAGLLGMAEAAG